MVKAKLVLIRVLITIIDKVLLTPGIQKMNKKINIHLEMVRKVISREELVEIEILVEVKTINHPQKVEKTIMNSKVLANLDQKIIFQNLQLEMTLLNNQ